MNVTDPRNFITIKNQSKMYIILEIIKMLIHKNKQLTHDNFNHAINGSQSETMPRFYFFFKLYVICYIVNVR